MISTTSLPLRAALATTMVAALLGAPSLMSQASAVGTATGFAAQNGGTTGGAGGTTVSASTGTQIHQALCGRAGNSTPITIQVSGTITVGNTAKVSGSCNTAAGVIELKDVSNITIIGSGSAVFDQIGIHIRNSSNIIIQNVTVKNVKKSGSPTSNGGDAIGMESSVHNVWVDHVSLEASGGESEGYDALFDMKAGTTYVTLSYSTLKNSGRGGLVGSSDSDTSNGPVTYHHNLYQNLDSRTPLLRSATAHIYNNYYVNLNESGINPRNGGKAKVDNNYFKDSKDVLGTFYTNLPGYWQTSGNILDNVTWSAKSSENNPAGPSMASTTTVNIPYSYTLDGASCVPSIVAGTAGAGKGLAVSNGSCSVTSPTSSTTTRPVITTTTTTSLPVTGTTTTSRPTTTTTSRSAITTTGGSTGLTCTATNSAWSGGFVTNVTITNGGSSVVNGWKATLGYDRSVVSTGAWGATVTTSGAGASAVPVSYTQIISANGTTTFGFQGTASGVTPNPTCTVS
jgi:pectate lyase